MTVQTVVFLLYFLVVFTIGFICLRLTRDETDYWIAGGKLGWVLGGATLGATHASAGTFVGVIGVVYGTGWSFAWVVFSIPAAYWFMAAVLAPRFAKTKELTLPAFLESRYRSVGVRRLAAAIILVAIVVYVQAQIVAGGLIANIVFGISPEAGMVSFTAILLAYTAIGGMLAVVYTDFLQLVVMVAGVVVALPLAIQKLGGTAALFSYVVATKPETFTFETLPQSLLFTMGMAFMLGTVATPEKLVRLYAMKDMKTIRRGVLLAIIAATGLNLVILVMALTSIVLFPALPTGDIAMPMIARAVLPPVLGALLLAAITAAIMSTVDSLMLVAGSAFAYDLFGTLKPKASPRTRLWVGRLGILVIGTIPLLLIVSGVGEGEYVQFIVLLFTALMGASFFVPVVVGVYWPRGTKQGAAAAMLGGVMACFAWELFGSESIDPVLPGLAVSALLYFVVSAGTSRSALDSPEKRSVSQNRESEDQAVLSMLEAAYCPPLIQEARDRQDVILAERFEGYPYAIADVGCGTGYHGSLLAPAASVYHGFEIAPEIASMTRNRWAAEGLTNAELFVGDVASAELKRDFYDLVLCLYFTPGNFREPFDDLARYTDAYLDRNPGFITVIDRFYRAMKRGGRMLLTVYRDVPEAEDAQWDFYEHAGQKVVTPKGSRFAATEDGFWSVRFTRESLLSNVGACGINGDQVTFHELNAIAWLVEIVK